ncbi:hypothetical protein PROFUN_11716 [Planoprotostelium fungivorum]|uniref:Clu domain-containing protein n=1 Tax=Planoprotostelium fungivorum TaxID=1890364 RepID=A0A2P6N963_9EUKA|nr:hypothetical protein PROFUN_11716 [Planoprotostelium fungivorum]
MLDHRLSPGYQSVCFKPEIDPKSDKNLSFLSWVHISTSRSIRNLRQQKERTTRAQTTDRLMDNSGYIMDPLPQVVLIPAEDLKAFLSDDASSVASANSYLATDFPAGEPSLMYSTDSTDSISSLDRPSPPITSKPLSPSITRNTLAPSVSSSNSRNSLRKSWEDGIIQSALSKAGNYVSFHSPRSRNNTIYRAVTDSQSSFQDTEVLDKIEIKVRDWNAEYQDIRQQIGHALNEIHMTEEEDFLLQVPWHAGHKLAKEFADAAVLYAKIIINEIYLPDYLKTYQACDIGGVAGGQKYIVQNILFKFAGDTLLMEDPPVWMYGTDGPDHKSASRTSKNEMKGLEAMCNTHVPGLYYPMMISMGFRVLAMPVLPINKSTILYGSNDAGVTVHRDNETLNLLMQTAANRIHISGHVTGLKEKKEIYGPGDIEGHLGTDEKYYVVDFGRVMPPEDPAQTHHKNSKSVFYSLLRSQLVSSHPEALCSDAFTKWNSDDDEERRKAINEKVTKATMRIRDECVPDFANYLDALSFPWEHLWSPQATQSDLLKSLDIIGVDETHRRKLNIRHIGCVRATCKSVDVKKLIFSAMVARVVKDDFRDIMRLKMLETFDNGRSLSKAISSFCNQILGHSSKSGKYWNSVIRLGIVQKFGPVGLSKEESESEGEEGQKLLMQNCDLRLVLLQLFAFTGVRVAEEAMMEIVSHPKDLRFVESDFLSVEHILKHQSIVYTWGSMSLLSQIAKSSAKREWGRENTRQIAAAERGMKDAHMACPSCPLIRLAWALSKLKLADARDDVSQAEIDSCVTLISDAVNMLGPKAFLMKMKTRAVEWKAKVAERSGLKDEAERLRKEEEELRHMANHSSPVLPVCFDPSLKIGDCDKLCWL